MAPDSYHEALPMQIQGSKSGPEMERHFLLLLAVSRQCAHFYDERVTGTDSYALPLASW